MDVLKDNMVEIPPEELKKVAGGDCWDHCPLRKDRGT